MLANFFFRAVNCLYERLRMTGNGGEKVNDTQRYAGQIQNQAAAKDSAYIGVHALPVELQVTLGTAVL